MRKPYPCVYCTEDGYCEKYSDNETTSWCVLGPCENEKPSKGDRIRAMTDKELAELLSHRDVCPPGICQHMYDDDEDCAGCYDDEDCADCWLKWLIQPAQDEQE